MCSRPDTTSLPAACTLHHAYIITCLYRSWQFASPKQLHAAKAVTAVTMALGHVGSAAISLGFCCLVWDYCFAGPHQQPRSLEAGSALLFRDLCLFGRCSSCKAIIFAEVLGNQKLLITPLVVSDSADVHECLFVPGCVVVHVRVGVGVAGRQVGQRRLGVTWTAELVAVGSAAGPANDSSILCSGGVCGGVAIPPDLWIRSHLVGARAQARSGHAE